MKIKLLLFTALFSVACFSQNFPSFTSDPMTDFTIVVPATPIDQSPTGANAVWTFNGLNAGGNNIDTYAAPTAAELTTYPGTTEVLSITTQGMTPVISEFFLREDGSGSYITGVSQGDIVLNYNTTNAFIGLFPLNFGATNSGTAAGTFTFMGVNGTFTGTFTATVDAYGILNMDNPAGSDYSGNVTRLRIDQALSFSIPPIFNNIGTLTQTTYYYYDTTAANLAFRYTDATIVSGFLGINEATESFERNTAVTLSRNTVEAASFNIYPNPAKEYIIITSGDSQNINSVSIKDIQGRNVYTTSQQLTNVPVGNLKSGLYFITIGTESGNSVTKKFIKQ